MRCLKRNKQKFWYCTPTDSQIVVRDSLGNETGQYIQIYDDPVEAMANISPATGVYQTEVFGDVENYDRVIVIEDPDFPITEDTVLFVDKTPTKTTVTTYRAQFVQAHTYWVQVTYFVPVYNYKVWRISKSLNHVAIAVKKVPVGKLDGETPYILS